MVTLRYGSATSISMSTRLNTHRLGPRQTVLSLDGENVGYNHCRLNANLCNNMVMQSLADTVVTVADYFVITKDV